MIFFWKSNLVPREQVSDDVWSVLQAILKFCTVNADLLTQEERSSFVDECSSLAAAHAQWNGDTTYSTLTKAFEESKKLKSRIEHACLQHQLDNIRRGIVSPAATSIATPETRGLPLPLIDPNPSYRIPPSESSISVQSNLAVTNGSHLNPSDPSTGAGGRSVPSSASVTHETTSSIPAVSAETEGSRRAPATDIDCMVFDADSAIGSPTFNVDSHDSTGAKIIYPSDRPSPGFSAQRLPPTGARQSQTARIMGRERVMYFAPGTTVDSPTYNIRSVRSSGTSKKPAIQDSPVLTESFCE